MDLLNPMISSLSHHQTTIYPLRIVVALVSLLFSTLAFYTDNLVNSDGVLYLNMASAFLHGGLAATAEIYNWPFFSILIAYIHQWFGIGLETSAEILNSLLFVIFTDALILVSSTLLENKKQLFLAAILILCFVTLNDYRSYIIRDVGYWAFITIAVYRMALFIQAPTFQSAVVWQAASILAVLFRVEALVIMVLSPFFLLFQQDIKSGIKNSFKLWSGLLVIMVVGVAVALQQHGATEAFSKLQQFSEFINFELLKTTFEEKSSLIGSEVLNQYSEEYSSLILLSGLLTMFLVKLITGLGIINIGLFTFARDEATNTHYWSPERKYLIFFATLNLLILLSFLYKEFFISTRYMLMLIVSLFLLLLPTICQWLEKCWQMKKHTTLLIVSLLFLVGLVDTFHTSVKKGYVKEVAYWASENLPAHSKVLTDDKLIAFYFELNHPNASINLSPKLKQPLQHEFLIIHHKVKHPERHEQIKSWPLQVIHENQNKRGDRAVVYKIERDN